MFATKLPVMLRILGSVVAMVNYVIPIKIKAFISADTPVFSRKSPISPLERELKKSLGGTK